MSHLGPYKVGKLLGAGGMGRVYLARHEELGVDVAIKALLAEGDENQREQLLAEVQAMARMDHPHIGRIFDHGVARGSALPDGAPWFAMELLRSDLRRELSGQRRWSDVATYLQQLLDALGHAHARGVVHRDLKANNILVGRSDDLRPGLKLVDFGIAAVHHSSTQGVGTPSAMAPEQWTDGLDDIGPWTDIHALGQLVWRLVTGERPSGEAQGPGIYLRLRDERFEPFVPRFDVPEGLEAWLLTCLAADPAERYLTCPDALQGLVATGVLRSTLPPPSEASPSRPEPTISSHVTVPIASTALPPPSHRPRRPPAPVAPLPGDWRAPLPPPSPLHLAGLGRSLLAWRDVAFVGREDARETLWSTARALRRGKASRLTVTGPPGVGGSALGRWWVRRLRACSGTLAVVADSTLDDLLDQLLQPLGQPRDRAGRRRGLDRLRAGFRAAVDAIAALDGSSSLDLRVGAALEVLGALARKRPVAVYVDSDDVELQSLAHRPLPAGVALVVRAGSTPIDDGPTIALRPLPTAALSALLDQLLPLTRPLHAALVEASGGHPAVLRTQLLQALPSLAHTPEGFDGSLSLADDDAPLAALQDLEAPALAWLEVAVSRGGNVQRSVWVRAARVPPRTLDALTEQLVRRGLATPTPWGMQVPPSLVTALQRRARRAGRDRAHQAAMAQALSQLGGDPLSVGRCWMDAGEIERGAAIVLDGLPRVVRAHGIGIAVGVLADLEERLASFPLQERLHGRTRVQRLLLDQEHRGRVEATTAEATVRWALAQGWYDVAARAVRLHAWTVTLDQHALNEVYAAADQQFLAKCSPGARARLLQAWYLRLERFADPRRDAIFDRIVCDVDLARQEELSDDERHDLELVTAVTRRARLLRAPPDQELLEVARRCVSLSRQTGSAHLCLDLVELGHAHQKLQQFVEADRAYAEAAWTGRWLGIPRAETFATGNRAGLAILQGDWERAHELAQRALVGANHAYLQAVLELFCLVRAAVAGRAHEVFQVLERIGPELAKVRPIDEEVDAALVAIGDALDGVAPDVVALARTMRS